MALTVEDGTGISTAESYISVTDADTYHTNFGNSAWTGTTAVKEAALRKAAQYLDGKYGQRFKGVKAAQANGLEWPRVGASDADGYTISSSTVPDAVVDACAELAVRQLGGELAPDLERGGDIQRVKAGSVEVEYGSGASDETAYRLVDYLLAGLMDVKGRIVRA